MTLILHWRTFHSFITFRYTLAKEIVPEVWTEILNIEDLTKVKGFPVDKAKIITLYLVFN
jgi:hypothetical protein